MSKKKLLLIIVLFSPHLWGVVGVPYAQLDFQFSTPLVYLDKNDINSTDEADSTYGDMILRQVTFPFYLGFNLGYILGFDKQHSLLFSLGLKYSDDPINFMFDSSVATKLSSPQFTEQKITPSFFTKYNWKGLTDYLSFSTSLGIIANFTKNSSFNFDDNIYNFITFSLGTGFRFHNLGQVSSSLKGMEFNIEPNYSFNYYPNGDEDTKIGSDGDAYPATEKNFQTVSLETSYLFIVDSSKIFYFKYTFAFDHYLKQPIHNGDLDSPEYTSDNEMSFTHSMNLDFIWKLNEQYRYYLWELIFSYYFRYLDSNYVEYLSLEESDKGELSEYFKNAIVAGSELVFYQKDFKDHMVNLAGFYAKLNLNSKSQLSFGYTINTKYYLAVYGRQGMDGSYGSYLNENRLDMNHILSFSYKWYNESKSFSINPFWGVIFGMSNDATTQNNRHIYFIGVRGSYEI